MAVDAPQSVTVGFSRVAGGYVSTFVLIHGAWHGGWCWRRVAPLLRHRGHDVFTPTLTGLAERAHAPLTRMVDLGTHVSEVSGALEFEDLHDVVLVGHSYGGMVITGVAACCPGRVKELVYLDAFVPSPGQALIDFLGERADGVRRTAEENDGLIPSFPAEAFGVREPTDVNWVRARLRPQPAGTFMQALEPSAAVPSTIGRTYIFCLDRMGTFDGFADHCRNSPDWRYHELQTGHDAMLTAPQELSEVLLELA